jgi:hypothetical protein
MQLLSRVKMTGVDQHARDIDNMTALNLLRYRPDFSPELLEAFGALLLTVRHHTDMNEVGSIGNEPDEDEDEDEGSDLFEDAMEEFEITA